MSASYKEAGEKERYREGREVEVWVSALTLQVDKLCDQ